jgi:NAD(P) transhydrogenase
MIHKARLAVSVLLIAWSAHGFSIANHRQIRTAFRSSHSLLQMSSEMYDLAVIGAGPVGAQAAMVAAAAPYNKRVVLIDAPRASGMLMNEATQEDLSIGGPTGLFSKALRDTSKHISVSTLRGMGLREESVWNEIISNCVDLASSNAQDVFRQLEFAGVLYVEGFATFPDSGGTNSVFVTSQDLSVQTIKAKNILIATGSTPFRPGGIPFDGVRVFDSDSINQVRVTFVNGQYSVHDTAISQQEIFIYS